MTSRTKQFYSWLEEQDFLWMLEEPHDQLLAVFAGSAPVARMWHWSQQAVNLDGGEPPTAPETEADVEDALVLAEQIIRQRFSEERRCRGHEEHYKKRRDYR